MKLRILVLILVLANIALFTWEWTAASEARARSDNGPMARQIHPDAVQITPMPPQSAAQ